MKENWNTEICFFLHKDIVLLSVSVLDYETCSISVKWVRHCATSDQRGKTLTNLPRSETLRWNVPWGLILKKERKEKGKKTISKCVFLFAQTTTCIVVQCKWPWMPYWLASRQNGFVEQCYCDNTKKPGFNGRASPHEGRVQGRLQLSTVEVVFDQLLSAWLGVNRWTNYRHVHIYSTLYYFHILFFSNSISFKVTLSFPFTLIDLNTALFKSEDQPEWLLYRC